VAQTPTDTSFPACGLTGIGTTSPGITLINVPVGYRYYIIAVWEPGAFDHGRGLRGPVRLR
jgi:hypothetical protein